MELKWPRLPSITKALEYHASTGKFFNDKYWPGESGVINTYAGIEITPETAMKLSAAYACTRLIAESVAVCPIILYESGRTRDTRVRAYSHSLYRVLHDAPNSEQTPIEFKDLMTQNVLMRGNAYAFIDIDRQGNILQLVPLNPDLVACEQILLGEYPNGLPRLGARYRLKRRDGRDILLTDYEVFHLRGMTLDGVHGVSVLEHAAQAIGVGLAAEKYTGRFFKQGITFRGVIEVPAGYDEDAAKVLREDFASQTEGSDNFHRTPILEEGAQFKPISMSAKDAEIASLRELTVVDIARFFRVPPHLIGEVTKQSSWGTGIEQMSMAFLQHTMLPWFVRWEQTCQRDVISQPNRYYVEFLLEQFQRADLRTRYAAYAAGRQWGFLSVNDIRAKENMEPVPGGDTYLTPLNMTPMEGGKLEY